MIEVLRVANWLPAQFMDNMSRQGICDLQLTKIKVTGQYPAEAFGSSAGRPFNVVCYVRENVKLAAGGFTTHAAQRWGMKSKGSIPSTAKQVLELCMALPLMKDEVLIQAIGAELSAADGLHREVVTNKLFTVHWAEEQIKTSADEFKEQLAKLANGQVQAEQVIINFPPNATI